MKLDNLKINISPRILKIIRIAGYILTTIGAAFALYKTYEELKVYMQQEKAMKEAMEELKETNLASAFQLINANDDGHGNAGARWALTVLVKQKKELRSLRFDRADLSGLLLTNINAPYSFITYSNLEATNLSNATLNNSNFHCTTLTEADFSNAKLASVDLSGANITRANFKGSTIEKEQLAKACINKDEIDQKMVLPQIDFEIKSEDLQSCSPLVNGIRACIVP